MYKLIRFRYEHYCQGYEWATETVLVNLVGCENLSPYYQIEWCCNKIKLKYKNAKDFEDCTL